MSTQIIKKSLADEVAERLQTEITSKKYKVGDKLPTEPQLMAMYGVGRSTIREAIKILSNLGFLSVQQGVGTFVETQTTSELTNQHLKRADSYEVDEVRQILELKIAEKAALKRTEKDIVRIKKYLAQRGDASKQGLLEECIEADVNFHIAIAEAAHNKILADLYKLLSTHLKKGFKNLYTNTEVFIQSQLLHEQLVKHIVLQDTKNAYAAALKILSQH